MYRQLTLVLILTFSSASQAKDELFAESVNIDGEIYSLCSTAPLKAYKIFRVGDAALYMKNCKNRRYSFHDSPKQLSFYYNRKIPAHAFSQSALNFLKKNIDPTLYLQWESDFIRFNKAYLSTQRGDQYDIVHSPNNGLRLLLNGAVISSLSSDHLAKQYFKIWFGDKPFNKSLKQKLL